MKAICLLFISAAIGHAAIAYDSHATSINNYPITQYTFTSTLVAGSGNNRVCLVGVRDGDGSNSQKVSSVVLGPTAGFPTGAVTKSTAITDGTHNGTIKPNSTTAVTVIPFFDADLPAGSSTAITIQITESVSTQSSAQIQCVTGASQSTNVDQVFTTSGSGAGASGSITNVANNAWLFDFSGWQNNSGANGPTWTAKDNIANPAFADSATGPVSPGSHTESWTSNPASWAMVLISLGPAGFLVTPTVIPANHAGNITISISCSSCSFTGSTVLTPSGVANVTKVSQSITNGQNATVTITTGAGTGTETYTESVTGSSSGTNTISTATLSVSPSAVGPNSTPILFLTGANTIWTAETASTLFSGSFPSCTGASLTTATVNVMSDTSASIVLVAGSANCTITVTDTSTTATANVTVGASPVIISLPDARIWYSANGARTLTTGGAIFPQSGAYIRFVVTGTTTVTINVNTNINHGNVAGVMPSVVGLCNPSGAEDGNYSTIASYTDNQSLNTNQAVVSGLTGGTTYSCTIWPLTGGNTGADWWTSTINQNQINSIQFSAGATVTAYTPRPNTCLMLGDSYIAGNFGGRTTGGQPVIQDNSMVTWPEIVSFPGALNCEYVSIGYPGQGYETGVLVNHIPNVRTTWNHYDSAHAKTLDCPTYMFIAEGINDYTGITASDVTTMFAAIRAQCASTRIYAVVPPSRVNFTSISTGVTNVGDSKMYYTDPGTELQYDLVVPSPSTPNWISGDGTHLDLPRQNIIAAQVAFRVAQSITSGGGTGPGPIVAQ